MLPSLTIVTEKVPLLRSLRYPNFRLYWLGMAATTLGNQMRQVAMLWMVYQLTGSAMALGLVGGADGVASVILTLTGGVLADRVDRRKLLIVTNLTFFVLLFLLAAAALAGVITMWHLVVFAVIFGSIGALDQPTRQALIPNLIDDRKDLMNAIALHSTLFQTSRIIGPSIAGLLVAAFNPAVCFFITAAAYLAMTLLISRIKVAKADGADAGHGHTSPWGGVTYVRRNSIFSSVIGMVLVNSVFGMSFIYLMPIFAGDILKVDSRGYGLLMTFMGVGTLSGVLLGAMLGNYKRKWLLLLGGSAAYGAMLILLSSSRNLPAAAALIAVAGFSQHIYMLTAQTLVQYLVPDDVRGRVMAIYSLVWTLGPLGSLQAGAIASALSAPAAIGIGGAVVAGFSIFLLAAVPRLRKIDI